MEVWGEDGDEGLRGWVVVGENCSISIRVPVSISNKVRIILEQLGLCAQH